MNTAVLSLRSLRESMSLLLWKFHDKLVLQSLSYGQFWVFFSVSFFGKDIKNYEGNDIYQEVTKKLL